MDNKQLVQLKVINWIVIAALFWIGVDLFFVHPETIPKEISELNESRIKDDTKIYTLFAEDEDYLDCNTVLYLVSAWTFVSLTLGMHGLTFEKAYSLYLFAFAQFLLLVILPMAEVHVIRVKLNQEVKIYASMIDSMGNIAIDTEGYIEGDFAGAWNFMQRRYNCCGRVGNESLPFYYHIESADVIWALAKNNNDSYFKGVASNNLTHDETAGRKFADLLVEYNLSRDALAGVARVFRELPGDMVNALNALSEANLEANFTASQDIRNSSITLLLSTYKIISSGTTQALRMQKHLSDSVQLLPEVKDVDKELEAICHRTRHVIHQLGNFSGKLEKVTEIWRDARGHMEGHRMRRVNISIAALNATGISIEKRFASLYAAILRLEEEREKILRNMSEVGNFIVPSTCCDLSYGVSKQVCLSFRTFHTLGCFLETAYQLKTLVQGITQILAYETFTVVVGVIMSLLCGRAIEEKQRLLEMLRRISKQLQKRQSDTSRTR